MSGEDNAVNEYSANGQSASKLFSRGGVGGISVGRDPDGHDGAGTAAKPVMGPAYGEQNICSVGEKIMSQPLTETSPLIASATSSFGTSSAPSLPLQPQHDNHAPQHDNHASSVNDSPKHVPDQNLVTGPESCKNIKGNKLDHHASISISTFTSTFKPSANDNAIPTTKNYKSATSTASALIISAADKAGMSGIDRERINSIILRESGDSPFMQRLRKMDENTNRKVLDMKRKIQEKDKSSSSSEQSTRRNHCDWRKELREGTIDPILDKYTSQRHPISTCVVIDMDSFFIACHILTQPHLANVPACVGGSSMISTSNYAARKYGVRAAMPGYIGKTLVKELSDGKEDLTFVRSDFGLYKRKSEEVKKVLEEYDLNLKMYSLDEAYVDLGPYLEVQLKNPGMGHEEIRTILANRNQQPPAVATTTNTTTTTTNNNSDESNQFRYNPNEEDLADAFPHHTIHTAAKSLLHTIRQKVYTITGLTCSAGMASNFLLAKIASDFNKPNGQYFVGPSETEIREFIHPLPTRKVHGVGRVMEKMLREGCGVSTVKDLYDKRAEVYFSFKPATANFLMRASIGYAEWGKDRLSSEEEGGGGAEAEEAIGRKGISHERTFSPTSSWSDLCTKLETITHLLVQDLTERNLKPRTVTLKVKLANFEVFTRATTRDVGLFLQGYDRREAQDLVDMVVRLLKEAKRAHDKGTKSGSTVKNGAMNNNAKEAGKGGGPFSVRLLGVRCSNFKHEKDGQALLDRFYNSAANQPTDPAAHEASASAQISLSNNDDGNATPLRINPYLSPKSANSTDKSPTNGKQANPSSSRRSLYNNAKELSHSTISPNSGAASEPPVESLHCPICNKTFFGNKHDNAEINSHIDTCLNSSTVKQLAKEETVCADARRARDPKKKRKLTHFFAS